MRVRPEPCAPGVMGGDSCVVRVITKARVSMCGSDADARLRFTGGVLIPVLHCRWPDIGAECRIGIDEWRCFPQPHGAVGVSAGQQVAVGAERHPCTRRRLGPVSAGRGAPTDWPVTGFHSRTVPSSSALASSLPSGLNATP